MLGLKYYNRCNFFIFICFIYGIHLLGCQELLALEERMGTVSTALPEEAFSNCLRKSIYQFTPQEDASVSCDGKEDVKCSICQVLFQ